MAAGRSKAVVRGGAEGLSLELDPSLSPELKAGSELQVQLHAADALVLLKERAGQTGFFAGSLSALSLGEIFGQILSGIRSGRLVVQHGSTRRTLFFRDAQVVYGASTERHERLGHKLVQLGLVTEAQLKAALGAVKPGVKVGQALVSRGELSQSALYSAMTLLVREITVGLFEMEQGEFLFIEGGTPAEDALKLPERTRDLVLEGMKKGDEVQRLRQRYGRERVFSLGSVAPRVEEPAGFWQRLRKGPASVAELRPTLVGGEHDFYTLLREQLAAGALEERPQTAPTRLTPSPVESLSVPERYAALIEKICAALKAAGVGLEPVRSFLSEPQQGLEDAFVGVELSEDGTLDTGRILSNVQAGDAALSRAMAYEALDTFASYALFAAKNALPADASATLVEAYRAIQNEGA